MKVRSNIAKFVPSVAGRTSGVHLECELRPRKTLQITSSGVVDNRDGRLANETGWKGEIARRVKKKGNRFRSAFSMLHCTNGKNIP